MPETVNLNVSNFVQTTSTTSSATSTAKSDNSYSPKDSKDSFKKVLNNASSGANSKSYSDNSVKDSSVNNEDSQDTGVSKHLSNKDSNEDNKVNTKNTAKSTESKTSDNKVDAADDLQSSDEQQAKLKKINELLEEILSGITNGNLNVKDLSSELTKLQKELTNNDGDKKTSKLSDEILEVLSSLLSSASNTMTTTNANNITDNETSKLISLKDTLSQLNSDLRDLTNLLSNNKLENTKKLSANTKTNTELQQFNSQKTISAADLKLSQLASENVQSDEQNLLSKIKQELSQLTAAVKNQNSSEFSGKTTVANEGLSNLDFQTVSNKNSQLSTSNDGNKQNNNTNLKDDNKFLNDLIGDNKDDKFSKVTNLMNQLTQKNVSEVTLNSENPVINKPSFTADLIKSLDYMKNNDIQEMTVKIIPKELGEVLIKITSDGGIMKASITATNKDAYNLLNSNIQDLNKSLQNQDIKIQNVTINIYNGDTTFFSGNNRDADSSNDGNNKTNKLSSIGTSDSEDIETDESIYKENSINALA